jgi:YrbI family 3-deoxy-D-manno-octulosonate 8-phosphate phosphatase
MIKLLILDVDGVLTDGKKYYGVDGMPFAKTFCDKDWTSIKRFRACDVTVIFLTGDARVNEQVANKRNIPVYLSRGKDKIEFLEEFKTIYNCSENEIAFVGDDMFDINIMNSVKYSFCPSDSPSIVKENSLYKLSRKGGENLLVELFEICEENNYIKKLNFKECMIKINDLDKKELF